MSPDAALDIINRALDNAYDEAAFKTFAGNLFGEVEARDRLRSGNIVYDAFSKHVASYKYIAKYTDPEGEELNVLAVKLRHARSLDRARTMQRNFAAEYLRRKEEQGSPCETALVAYYADDAPDWRLSLVRLEYRTVQDEESGNVNTEKDLTPARRYSFLVGEGEPCHTACKQLLPLVRDEAPPTLGDLDAAFDIEVVTQDFFDDYKEHFLALKENLDVLAGEHAPIREEFASKGIDTATFAKKLLGQLVFLYFIQKKGWLGVPHGRAWGEGPTDFLRRLFEGGYARYDSFFDDLLEPLFYEALATQRGADNYYSPFDCRIPFLNGGLFEPVKGYRWEAVDIPLDHALFAHVLDTFDRYNFTVREDEPLEKEVAVDPEMLGKVFENLLDVQDRKSKGAFYTPREIVHYMCRETLVDYLAGAFTTTRKTPSTSVIASERSERGNLSEPGDSARPEEIASSASPPRNDTSGEHAAVPRDDLAALVRAGEHVVEHDRRVEREGRETRDYSYKLPDAIRRNARALDEALAAIKICDPAIGSGAFPVGMMQEVVRARLTLSTYLPDDEGRTAYRFKRHAIQHALYGVDLDAGAVDIARLRLWLSLVVDEDDFTRIQPLPNLRYRIVQGDALSGVERHVFNNEAEARLHRLIEEHIPTSNPRRKKELQDEIDALIAELTGGGDMGDSRIAPTFDFRIYFSEVFQANGGFDVVIGNPPYVRQESLTAAQKSEYKQRYQVYYGSADLYAYFIERGMGLLRKGGVFCYIVSNKWMRARYGGPLRTWLETQHLTELIDFGDLPVFQGATTYPCILRMTKRPPADAFRAAEIQTLAYDDLAAHVRTRRFEVPRRALDPKGWALVDRRTQKLLDKLAAAGTPLGEYLDAQGTDIYYGIKTGLNEAFVIDAATRARLVAEDPASAEIIKPLLKGRDIKRYQPPRARKHVIFTRRGIDIDAYPAVKEHLLQFKERLEPKPRDWPKGKAWPGRKPGPYEWYEIQDTVAYYAKFEQPKILFPDLATEGSFTFDENGQYAANTIYMIPGASKYLLGLLNSSLMTFYYANAFSVYRGGYLRFFTHYLEQLPIPDASAEEREQLRALAERQLALHVQAGGANGESDLRAQTAATDREIDRLVYDLYGLTEEEMAIVEAGRGT